MLDVVRMTSKLAPGNFQAENTSHGPFVCFDTLVGCAGFRADRPGSSLSSTLVDSSPQHMLQIQTPVRERPNPMASPSRRSPDKLSMEPRSHDVAQVRVHGKDSSQDGREGRQVHYRARRAALPYRRFVGRGWLAEAIVSVTEEAGAGVEEPAEAVCWLEAGGVWLARWKWCACISSLRRD